jgi:hypothetical protein
MKGLFPTQRQAGTVRAIKKSPDAGEPLCRELVVATPSKATGLAATPTRSLAQEASAYVTANHSSERFRRELTRRLLIDHDDSLVKLLRCGKREDPEQQDTPEKWSCTFSRLAEKLANDSESVRFSLVTRIDGHLCNR